MNPQEVAGLAGAVGRLTNALSIAEAQFTEAQEECARLQTENEELKARVAELGGTPPQKSDGRAKPVRAVR